MIYDCFIFFNELDLLEIRLNVLKDVVDRFVLVEATKTHTGKDKPLHYQENKARFAAFEDKIIHVVVDDFPNPPEGYSERDASWMRENFQRNAIMRGLKDAQDDDLILISDLDEIPNPEVVSFKNASGSLAVCEQLFMNFYINYLNHVRRHWYGSRICQYALFKGVIRSVEPHYGFNKSVNVGMTPTRLRFAKADRILRNAGWHFSYLGGAEAIIRKIGSIAVEYANENSSNAKWITETIEKGEDITGCGGRYFVVPIDGRFPKYIRDNVERYKALIYRPDADYYRRNRWPRIECFIRGWIRKNGAKLIPRPCKDWLYHNVYCKIVKEPIVM